MATTKTLFAGIIAVSLFISNNVLARGSHGGGSHGSTSHRSSYSHTSYVSSYNRSPVRYLEHPAHAYMHYQKSNGNWGSKRK